ncbi:MAG: shikimate kinase [Bacteroidia bacterium]|jgi:shikimate kinase|nr:shikimate kinase [Bacteroidia bacterium]
MHKKPEHIFLIGFMGAGKTTIGKKLATTLQRNFIDTDKWITEKYGKSVADIINQQGEAYFRIAERDCIHEITSNEAAVIATGGGLPCYYDNMEWMNSHGMTIYLKGNASFFKQRLSKSKTVRPLLSGLDKDSLQSKIEEMLTLREPYYSKANHTLHLPVKSLQSLLNAILQLV